jgi:hypothetical protein
MTTIGLGTPYPLDVSTDIVQIDQNGVWGRVARNKDGVYIEVAPQNADDSKPEPDDCEWGEPEMWADDMPLQYASEELAQEALENVASGNITITYC